MLEVAAAALFCDMNSKADKTGYYLKFNFGKFAAGMLQAGLALVLGALID